MLPTTRRSPFGTGFGQLLREMDRFQREMNRLFDRFFPRDGGWAIETGIYPALNIWEDDDALYVEAELPGMQLEDLEIYVTGDDQLTIKGERKAPQVGKGTWHRQERTFGSFTRLVTLPVAVDPDRVEAELRNGVLTIKLPKKEEAKPRRITVQAG